MSSSTWATTTGRSSRRALAVSRRCRSSSSESAARSRSSWSDATPARPDARASTPPDRRPTRSPPRSAARKTRSTSPGSTTSRSTPRCSAQRRALRRYGGDSRTDRHRRPSGDSLTGPEPEPEATRGPHRARRTDHGPLPRGDEERPAEDRQRLTGVVRQRGELRHLVVRGARLGALVDPRVHVDVVPARLARDGEEDLDVSRALEGAGVTGERVVVAKLVDLLGLGPSDA